MRRSLPVAAAGLLVMAAAAAGCSQPEASCADYYAEMDDIRGDEEATAALTATVMLIDVADNSGEAADDVTGAFEPEIGRAVEDGGWLVARLSGGDEQSIRGKQSCFSSNHAYKVERNNAEGQEDEQREAKRVLADALHDEVRGTPVAPRGSAVRLLDEGHDVVRDLLRDDELEPSQITVVLYSDLLGISDDCLNLDGRMAVPDDAEQIVDTCFTNQEILALPDDVRFVTHAVGDRADTTAQETLAGHVENLLCHRISTACDL